MVGGGGGEGKGGYVRKRENENGIEGRTIDRNVGRGGEGRGGMNRGMNETHPRLNFHYIFERLLEGKPGIFGGGALSPLFMVF